MTMPDSLAVIVSGLLTLAAFLLPVFILSASVALVGRIAPRDFFRIPALGALPKLAGFTLGIAALYDRDDRSVYDFSLLFDDGSFWNMPAQGFLQRRGDPTGYRLVELLGDAFVGIPDPLLDQAALVSASLLVLAGMAALVVCRGLDLARTLIAIPVLALFSAFLTVYSVSLALWSANLLNFWIFLLLAAILQRRRYSGHSAHH
jgi:hypothetical protein